MNAARIAALLPGVFRSSMRSGNLLSAFVDVMEEQHAPCERALDRIDEFFDPRRAPDAFVPFLARWVHFDHLYDDGGRRGRGAPAAAVASLGQLRELVASAAFLAKWRGTSVGMLRFLHTAIGFTGFRIDEPRGKPFHLRVTAPARAQPQEDLIHKVIRMAKPAHVSYELAFEPSEPPKTKTKDKP